MSNRRSSKLWIVNVTYFILFIILCSTGLLNWLVLPKGYQGRGSFLISLRHLFIAIHEWVALIFMVVVAIHIILLLLKSDTNIRERIIINGLRKE
jgi:hypothetical protein